jgi:Fe-Mn family superoxide dismutase
MHHTQGSNPQLDAALQQTVKRRDFLKMAAALGGSALALSQTRLTANAATPKKPAASGAARTMPADHPMHTYNAGETIQAMTFPNLSTVEGISQNQLNQHLELYNGYVKKINEIQAQINEMTPDLSKMNATYSPYRELHVEQTYALNGVILHEYYFENMGGSKIPATQTEFLHKIITQEFGSWENYINHLLAVAKSMRGWAITGYNMRDHRVHNYGLDLHNQWVPMHVIPLLVLDVYEHAYMVDFGIKRPAYLDAFMHNVNWQVVDNRLKTMILHG